MSMSTKKNLKKQTRRRETLKKQTRRRATLKKQTRRRATLKKQTRRRATLKKQTRRRAKLKKRVRSKASYRILGGGPLTGINYVTEKWTMKTFIREKWTLDVGEIRTTGTPVFYNISLILTNPLLGNTHRTINKRWSDFVAIDTALKAMMQQLGGADSFLRRIPDIRGGLFPPKDVLRSNILEAWLKSVWALTISPNQNNAMELIGNFMDKPP